ncbi:hypothetical protein TIFTF001_043729 [Ficus carica]|uniref:Uncharacterized protein n=1 Tax=Ficus carica TaxID=3494 RepID=A0AA87ZFQ5_FICCA|nr:hypothetical protein TIFTF001_043729 [Ficus carica]
MFGGQAILAGQAAIISLMNCKQKVGFKETRSLVDKYLSFDAAVGDKVTALVVVARDGNGTIMHRWIKREVQVGEALALLGGP